MSKIRFAKNRPEIEVPTGSNLMQILLENDIAVASSCGGEGVCSKCVIMIKQGMENLSPKNELENDMNEIHDFARNERMSCQTQVFGDITIDTTYW